MGGLTCVADRADESGMGKPSESQGDKPRSSDDKALSPRMRELILSFEAKRPLKRRRRDARGRFVSSR